MTTPPRTVSVLGLLTALVLGAILLVGAFEIPVPAIRVSIEVDPTRNGAPGRAEPPPPEPPTVEVPAGTRAAEEEPPSVEETLTELRSQRRERQEPPPPPVVEPEPSATEEPPVQVRVVEPPGDELAREPTFTPFTEAPQILNRDEIVQAMVAAYPDLLRDAGVGGRVRVYFFIGEDGRVRDTRIDQSSGHPALDAAALSVARVYRFSPAMNGAERVPVWVSFPLTFQAR